MQFRGEIKRPVYGAILALVFIVGVVAVWQRTAITDQLNAWQLLPQPERFTELYFENHQSLPRNYSSGETQSFSFTLHNHERESISYTYEISGSDPASQPITFDTQSLRLNPDERRTLTATIVLPDLGPRPQIRVLLTNNQKAIHYWIERRG